MKLPYKLLTSSILALTLLSPTPANAAPTQRYRTTTTTSTLVLCPQRFWVLINATTFNKVMTKGYTGNNCDEYARNILTSMGYSEVTLETWNTSNPVSQSHPNAQQAWNPQPINSPPATISTTPPPKPKKCTRTKRVRGKGRVCIRWR